MKIKHYFYLKSSIEWKCKVEKLLLVSGLTYLTEKYLQLATKCFHARFPFYFHTNLPFFPLCNHKNCCSRLNYCSRVQTQFIKLDFANIWCSFYVEGRRWSLFYLALPFIWKYICETRQKIHLNNNIGTWPFLNNQFCITISSMFFF